MGLPIWKPKDDHPQQQQKLQSPPKPQHGSTSPSPHPLHAHYRLYRRQQRSTTITSRPTNTSSYYLAPDHHLQNNMLHPLTTEQLQQDHHFPPLRSHAAEERRRNDNNSQQLEQRVNEKQELLDQLNITISLLDQFLSMRDLSGEENVALPPFITDDLLAILTATSATLTSTSTSSTMGPGRSYDQGPPSSTNPSSIDTPSPQASRLADLESSIVSAHHRVSDRLNLLGAILPVPSTTTR